MFAVFAGFEYGDNFGGFPDAGNCVGVQCDVVELCDVCDGSRSKMF